MSVKTWLKVAFSRLKTFRTKSECLTPQLLNHPRTISDPRTTLKATTAGTKKVQLCRKQPLPSTERREVCCRTMDIRRTVIYCLWIQFSRCSICRGKDSWTRLPRTSLKSCLTRGPEFNLKTFKSGRSWKVAQMGFTTKLGRQVRTLMLITIRQAQLWTWPRSRAKFSEMLMHRVSLRACTDGSAQTRASLH